VEELSRPFRKNAYYMPFKIPDPNWGYGRVRVSDVNTGEILGESPSIMVNAEGDIEGYLAGVWDAVFTHTGEEFHLGQAPPHWFGQFANNETKVNLKPALTEYGDEGLFLNQMWDRFPYSGLPYELYQEGEMIATGETPAYVFDRFLFSGPAPLNIDLPSPGAYSLTITYDQYWIYDQPGQARVMADFDTTCPDKDPPTLLSLNVLYDGETTDLVPPSATSEVRFRVQDPGGLSQVSLFYQDDDEWIPLPLTSLEDEYTAQLPGLENGAYISLKIVAQDATGNTLAYEVVPAFKVGVRSPVPLSPHDGWVTQDHDITFVWEAVPEAASYQIQIDTTEAFTSSVLISDTVTSTCYTTTLGLGTWYWRVQAIDETGNESDHCPVLSFTVADPVVQVTADIGDDYDPSIVQTADGTLWVVWHSYRSGNADIWYRISSDGGTSWSAATQLTTDTDWDYAPSITQAADGTLWVVWYSRRSGNYDLWYKTSTDDGASWSAATQLTTDTGSDYAPAITQAADGTLWVVWYSYRSGNADVW